MLQKIGQITLLLALSGHAFAQTTLTCRLVAYTTLMASAEPVKEVIPFKETFPTAQPIVIDHRLYPDLYSAREDHLGAYRVSFNYHPQNEQVELRLENLTTHRVLSASTTSFPASEDLTFVLENPPTQTWIRDRGHAPYHKSGWDKVLNAYTKAQKEREQNQELTEWMDDYWHHADDYFVRRDALLLITGRCHRL